MQTLLKSLYAYAQEQKMIHTLRAMGVNYQTARKKESDTWDTLEKLLSPENAALLTQYMEEKEDADYYEDLALFRCGVSIGLELGRF